jgi:Family of unknown function (DUF6318)
VARGTGTNAVKAFARHYIALVNFSSRTGRTSDLEDLSAQRCQSCRAIIRSIRDVYSAGGRIDSSGWSLNAVSLVPEQPTRRPILELGVIQSPERVRARSHGPIKRYKGGKQPMTMYLGRAHGAWSVTRLDLVPS